jgi:hypothetical protein
LDLELEDACWNLQRAKLKRINVELELNKPEEERAEDELAVIGRRKQAAHENERLDRASKRR